MQNETKIMEYLREIYRKKDKALLKREFYKNIFHISKENQIKINNAISSLPNQMTISDVRSIIGGKII
jgi:hypothetical protein